MERVSIIISVYNSERYLEECVDSALNQTYNNTEVIAVYDEGTTDSSLQILNKYSNKIRIISKENGRLGSALNIGIRESTGEWIKQLDSDDILYPDAVESLLLETKNFEDKTNTIFYANYDLIDSNGKIIGRFLEPNYNDLTKFDYNVILLDHHIGNPGTTLVHKSIFDKYGYYDEAIMHEDYDLRLRFCLLHHCRLLLIEKTVEKYRIHTSQASLVKSKKEGYIDKIRNNVLDQLDPKECERYRIALFKFKKNKPIQQKIKEYLGLWIVVNLPTSISNKIRIFSLRSRTKSC